MSFGQTPGEIIEMSKGRIARLDYGYGQATRIPGASSTHSRGFEHCARLEMTI
jgi:hypothetical protein